GQLSAQDDAGVEISHFLTGIEVVIFFILPGVGKDWPAVIETVGVGHVVVTTAVDVTDFFTYESDRTSTVFIATPQVDIFQVAIELVNPGTDSRKVNMGSEFPATFCA